MRARVVDWSLLALVLIGVGSGLWSFLVGDPQGTWLFMAHGMLGITLVGVLVLKARRVTPLVLTQKGRRPSAVAGILTFVAALATMGSGMWWVVAQTPATYPNGMILHTTAALILLGLCIWHLLLRYRPLTGRDFRNRRSLLYLGSLLLAGGALWGSVEVGQRALGTPGLRRRFTGSRLEEGPLPVTMWMFDKIPVVDENSFTLTIGGRVATPYQLTLDEVKQMRQLSLTATLDCTGGWYKEEEWRGLRVGTLLDAATLLDGAAYVRFRSATGYRWSLPVAEAMDCLLATHVGDVALDPGHGAPLRLVARGRRGFQWVKWVVAIEVLEAPDLGQWAAIFTSGVDRDL